MGRESDGRNVLHRYIRISVMPGTVARNIILGFPPVRYTNCLFYISQMPVLYQAAPFGIPGHLLQIAQRVKRPHRFGPLAIWEVGRSTPHRTRRRQHHGQPEHDSFQAILIADKHSATTPGKWPRRYSL